MQSKTVAIIPVKDRSTRILGKNYKLFNDEPLFYWITKACDSCKAIDRVLLATDSEQIKKQAKNYKFKKTYIVSRPADTCTDTASSESVMLALQEHYVKFDNIILAQATSPLTTSEHLQEALMLFKAHEYDSMLSVVEQKRFLWKDLLLGAEAENYNPERRPRSQDFKHGYCVENGAFYITKRELFFETKCRLAGRIGLYKMPEIHYFELDTEQDWKLLETLAKTYNCEEKVA